MSDRCGADGSTSGAASLRARQPARARRRCWRKRSWRAWWIAFDGRASLLSVMFVVSIVLVFVVGIGIWGNNTSVVWGFAVANYVWWIGIGNAGTLISAMLLLTRQHWRASINRFAEAMTLFAVAIAGLFPILHLGRPAYFYVAAALSQHHGRSGRSGAARWSGTSGRSRAICCSRSCSGTSG